VTAEREETTACLSGGQGMSWPEDGVMNKEIRVIFQRFREIIDDQE